MNLVKASLDQLVSVSLFDASIGETVGELDVITSSPRTTTLHAIRDTELVRMPLTLFNAISVRCESELCIMKVTNLLFWDTRHPKTTIQFVMMLS